MLRKLFRRADTGRFTTPDDAASDPAGTVSETMGASLLLILKPSKKAGGVVIAFPRSIDDADLALITKAHHAGLLGPNAPFAP